MIRTQVQFSKDEYRALKEEAARRQVSIAALVRESVEKLLEESSSASIEEKRKRALEIVGMFQDVEGASDVAANHDKYLADIYGS